MSLTPEKFIKALALAGFAPQAYSGRGGYGKQCVGVVLREDDSEFQVAAKVAIHLRDVEETEDEFEETLEDLADLEVRSDSMGRNTVIWFPRVLWVEAEDTEAEED